MTIYKEWTAASLREPIFSYPAGSTVFVKVVPSSSTPSAFTASWYLKCQGVDNFHTISDSYAGKDMYRLVIAQRNSDHSLKTAPPKVVSSLEKMLVQWRANLPLGSKPFRSKPAKKKVYE